MPYGMNQEFAELSVRGLTQAAKLIDHFQDQEDKVDSITKEVEKVFGEVAELLKDEKFDEALEHMKYHDYLDALRATRRCDYGAARKSFLDMIDIIEDAKGIPQADRDDEAIEVMLKSVRRLYTILIDQNIRNSTEITDRVVFQIERFTTAAGKLYDIGLRPAHDSEDTIESLKDQIKSVKKEKKLKEHAERQPQLAPQGLPQLG